MKRSRRSEHESAAGSWDDLLSGSDGGQAPSPVPSAIVIYVGSGRCRAVHREQEIDVVMPSGIAVRQKSALAVGDRLNPWGGGGRGGAGGGGGGAAAAR